MNASDYWKGYLDALRDLEADSQYFQVDISHIRQAIVVVSKTEKWARELEGKK